ncbi:PAS domain S-box protein [Heliorestis acidaminivorans]|uniref:histidine kinase n=1 Tax=Heliorestis acidaminivorans TaxID=553427 RepID=A0A6I0EXV1_9FIRM|nr:ATP-binding protein [Heliorestis acidaminivorans]KAB2954639.1 PAS domain S-box protein [Heliorestis acidaminivorans]
MMLLEQELSEDTKNILEHLLDCFGIYQAFQNEDGEIVDFVVVYLNRSATQFISIDKSTLIGKKMSDLIPLFQRTRMFSILCEVISKGEPIELPCHENINFLNHRKAVELKLFKHGKNSVAISWRDKSELLEIEESAQLSKELFQKVFNVSPIPMAILDIVTEVVLDVNESFLNISEYNREDIIGRTTRNVLLYEKIEDRNRIYKILREKGSVRNMQLNLRTRTNQQWNGLLSAETIMIDKKFCLLIQISDITEIKRLEEELIRLERFNLVGQLAAGIGHEIRNPITSVRGFLQVLQAKEPLKCYDDYFNLMIKELDRANQILTDFLSLAKQKVDTRKEIELSVIINELKPLIEAEALNENKQVLFDLKDIPIFLLVDEKEIKQLLLNMVRNGFEAMQAGKTLCLRTYMANDEVILAIKDEGAGIKPEILNKLGTPFITSKESGTGLGLAICYSIAARNQASIRVESSDKGTIFYVHFKGVQHKILSKPVT